MEGTLRISDKKIEALLDDGKCIELEAGDRFEVLVFSALLRFEWITVELAVNDGGFYLKAPASRPVPLKKVSKIRIEDESVQ